MLQEVLVRLSVGAGQLGNIFISTILYYFLQSRFKFGFGDVRI